MASSLASSGAVRKLALEITMSGEKKPKMKCFCPQAWPGLLGCFQKGGKVDRSFVKGTGMGVIAGLEVSESKTATHQQKSAKRDHCRDFGVHVHQNAL